MPVIEDLHTLLGNTDPSIDPVLTVLKNRAITLIKNYLNNSSYDGVYIEANFPDAIVELVCNTYAGKGKENIQSETQGSRSTTYKSSTVVITDSVKTLLPVPSVRMMG